MKEELNSFQYGEKNIKYNLFHVNRKTLQIAVHPDSSVVIKAPTGADKSTIEGKLRKRAKWIVKQLNYFSRFIPRTPERVYVSGETHLYLGRQYRLKIVHDAKDCVKLIRGFFLVSCKNGGTRDSVMKLMDKWYEEKASEQFHESLERCWTGFAPVEINKPTLQIKNMKKRWGSLLKTGTFILNKKLIKAPKECIDYVVTHELCHIKFHNHSAEFYRLLDSVLPDWEKRKQKLEKRLA